MDLGFSYGQFFQVDRHHFRLYCRVTIVMTETNDERVRLDEDELMHDV
jgi:hypothetical protein